jgi:hypothetical protein
MCSIVKSSRCKRGNISERNKWGHCLCVDCKEYRRLNAKPHSNEYVKEWRSKNKEKNYQYVKKWNDSNKQKRRDIEKAWKIKNPEKVKLYNKKSGAKWAKNNKGIRNAIDIKRKTSLLQRTPKWADLEKIKQFYIEAAKLTKETGIPYEVDHIIPLQGKLVSGLHVHNNLQILTRSENRSKRNKYDCELQ